MTDMPSRPDDDEAGKPIAVSPSVAAKMLGLSLGAFTRHVLPHVPHRKAGVRVLVSVVGMQRWLDNVSASEEEPPTTLPSIPDGTRTGGGSVERPCAHTTLAEHRRAGRASRKQRSND